MTSKVETLAAFKPFPQAFRQRRSDEFTKKFAADDCGPLFCLSIIKKAKVHVSPCEMMWSGTMFWIFTCHERERRPISLRSRVGGDINCRIAANTTLNCLSYLLSSSSRRRASSVWDASNCRSFTKARMISMLITQHVRCSAPSTASQHLAQ